MLRDPATSSGGDRKEPPGHCAITRVVSAGYVSGRWALNDEFLTLSRLENNMPRLSCLVLALCLGVAPLISAQEKEKVHPQESLETAIPHAIKLLEEKKYKELIDSYSVPVELKKLKEAGRYEKVVNEFGEKDMAEFMLNALKQAQKLEPTFIENETVAKYQLKPSESDSGFKPKSLVLKKIKKRWYIAN
jgi:hypothetical protein